MRVPRLTVDVMAAIIALAEKKNLEPTGKELGLTPSAVHKRIQIANQLFKARLFMNTNSSIQLTDVGRVFYSHAIKAMEQILLTEEVTIKSSELEASRLVLGHSTYLPPRLLALLHNQNFISALRIRLEHKAGLTMSLAQDVMKGRLHAGLGYLPLAYPDLLIYPLAEEPVLVCMPNGHRLASRPVIRPHDLEGEPVIAASREIFPILHAQVEDFFLDFGIKLNIVADGFGPTEAVGMTEQRLGISFVTASNVRARSSVVARPLTPGTLTRQCGLFIRADNRHPALQSFVDLMIKRTAVWQLSK